MSTPTDRSIAKMGLDAVYKALGRRQKEITTSKYTKEEKARKVRMRLSDVISKQSEREQTANIRAAQASSERGKRKTEGLMAQMQKDMPKSPDQPKSAAEYYVFLVRTALRNFKQTYAAQQAELEQEVV